MRLPHLLAAASVLAALAALVGVPAAHATPGAVKLDPLTLPAGPVAKVPHVEGTTLVDGRLRIPVKGTEVRYVGQVGSRYVLDVDRPRRKGAVVLVDRDGSTTRLAVGGRFTSVLSEDGTTVVTALSRTYRKTTVTAFSVTTGEAVASHVFKALVEPMTARGSQTVLRSLGRPGTFAWDATTDVVTEVTRRYGNRADIGLDLLASFATEDGLIDCTVVSRLSDPSVELWRSCDDAVIEFSPDGTHVATSSIINEGYPIANRVTLRRIDGSPVATYRPAGGFLVATTFETGSTLLLEPALRHAAGDNAAFVRCERRSCERAGRTYRLTGVFS